LLRPYAGSTVRQGVAGQVVAGNESQDAYPAANAAAVVSSIEGGYSFFVPWQACLGGQLLGSFSFAFACDTEDIGWAD
jgi:hypothetical protein